MRDVVHNRSAHEQLVPLTATHVNERGHNSGDGAGQRLHRRRSYVYTYIVGVHGGAVV